MTDVAERATIDLDVDVHQRILAVASIVQADAEAAERARTPLPRTIAELTRHRMFGLQAPRAVGGDELDPLEALEAFASLARLDTSVGWCTAVGNTGAALLGAHLGDEAADVVFRHGVPLVAGSFAPTGTATPTDGGYRVSGRWSFASGIRHAAWVTGGCVAGPRSEPITVVLPKDAVAIVDNWHVAGLQGTGSCDWTATDVFVPHEFTMRPEGSPLRGGAVFRLPLFCFIAAAHTGFALGCAQRALDELMAVAPATTRLQAAASVASRSAFQRDVGRADVAVRAARLVAQSSITTAWHAVTAGQPVPPAVQAEMRAAATHATLVAVETCTLAFRALGARALSISSPVQRYFRDINAAAQHVYVADTTFEELAQLRLGLPESMR